MLLDFAPFQKQFYKVFFEFKVIAIVLHFALFKNYFKKFSAKVFLWVLSHCHFYLFFLKNLFTKFAPKKMQRVLSYCHFVTFCLFQKQFYNVFRRSFFCKFWAIAAISTCWSPASESGSRSHHSKTLPTETNVINQLKLKTPGFWGKRNQWREHCGTGKLDKSWSHLSGSQVPQPTCSFQKQVRRGTWLPLWRGGAGRASLVQ